MKYKGSCHCRKIAFEAEGELNGAMACNCSMCSRKGSLLWFVSRAQFHLLTAEDLIGTYTFNKHVIKHRFCATCGIHPYGEGTDPNGNRIAAEWIVIGRQQELSRFKPRFLGGPAQPGVGMAI